MLVRRTGKCNDPILLFNAKVTIRQCRPLFQLHQLLDQVSSILVPVFLIPLKGTTAVGIVTTLHANLITIVDAGNAGIEEHDSRCSTEPPGISLYPGQETVGVMAVQKIQHLLIGCNAVSMVQTHDPVTE